MRPVTDLQRKVAPFKVVSDFAPAGDQPKAIAQLAEGINRGDRFQTLLGITGSGKSATMAWTIEQVQRPTLVIAPNKSLAAQLANEFREFFPHNRVEYFVSYYDYYQPEAYLPSSDTYIEKDSSINDEIDRLRHSATAALLTRKDVIVVASVSCIYGMGSPDEYRGQMIDLSVGVEGRRIRGGEAAEPVREVIISSTLQRMLTDVVAVGADLTYFPWESSGVTLAVGDVMMSGR